MNASYRHLTLLERKSIIILLAQGKKQSEIARQLGRSCSTISCPALANFHRHGACYRRRHLPASQRIEKVLRRWLAVRSCTVCGSPPCTTFSLLRLYFRHYPEAITQ